MSQAYLFQLISDIVCNMFEFDNYRRNLSVEQEKNLFVLPWACVAIKNCKDDGDLLKFSTKKESKGQQKSLWLLLRLAIFRADAGLTPVFVCPECDSMRGVINFCLDQDRDYIEQLKCIHSKAAEGLLDDYDNLWIVTAPEDEDQNHTIKVNEDILVQSLIDEPSECFLGAVQNDNQVSLLYTVSKKQKIPFCSRCPSPKCKCFFEYKKRIREHVNVDEQEELHWERRKVDAITPRDDYNEALELNEQYKRFGYNITPFEYPIKRDDDLQAKLINRMGGQINIPDRLEPSYEGALVCKHGFGFNSSDVTLVQTSQNVIIYTNTQDIIIDSVTLARPTSPAGSCQCLQQYDGHPVLLWHLGRGRMVDYAFLHVSAHQVINGSTMHSIYQTRETALSSLGISSTLTYQDFERACSGFVSMIRFRKEDFMCDDCGQTPRYIVADGKMTAPTVRKVQHLDELAPEEDDDQVLQQGSQFKDRVFLHRKKERDLVKNLLSETINIDDFIASNEIQSDNVRLIIPLLESIQENWPAGIPEEYRRFICNLCKPTSLASYMQVTSDEPLQILQSFCDQTLNVRLAQNQQNIKILAKELPALWPNLLDVMNLESSLFLPNEVAQIVKKMIEIRRGTFDNAARRSDNDYIRWPSPEDDHPTQCYPAWPIFRYPKKYDVNSRVDSDYCEKSFDYKKGFAFGVFSVGCCCPKNITYGWELMLSRESAHNLFRLLMCRNLNMDLLEGVIFDFACGLDPYLLNREPREFQYLRTLVDGAHWQGQKRLRRPDRNGAGGHLGCSEGYNFNLYKEHLPHGTFSQGREQLHSKMEKMVDSLIQMEYSTFMLFMKLFFGINNLRNKGKL